MERFKNKEKGLTLVELMVALVIGLILIAGIYALYRSTQDTYIGQEKLVELQQNSRIVLEQVTREMRLSGYLADCDPTVATDTTFEFEADTDGNGTAERIQYLYVNDPDDPDYKTLKRAPGIAGAPCTPMASPSFQKIATNIDLVHFDYYDDGNCLWPCKPGDGLDKIQRVTIRLEASTLDKLTNTTRKVSLMSDVRLRNEGLLESGACAPPSAPAGLTVTDIQVCGRAKVRWDANDADDQVINYRLYTRVAGTQNWLTIDNTGTATTFTKTDLVNGTSYEFMVAAQNNCEVGPESVIVTVGPLNDNIAPQAAAPPWLNEGATAVSNGNTVTLTWNASVSTNYQGQTVSVEDGGSDVSGYNVFRSGTQVNGALVPGLTYIDTVPVACMVYNYQIRTVDTCGNISALSAAAYGDADLSGGITDSPDNRTTNTRPSETVAPTDPADFAALSGGKHPPDSNPATYRITLSWKHATDVDVEGTRVRYKEKTSICAAGDYPSTSTSNTLLVDQAGEPGAAESNNYDIFKNNRYYCFTAFAYDACTNYSSGTQATAQAKTCGDEPVGAPSPINLASLKLGISDQGVKCCDVSGENRSSATIEWTTTQDLVNTPDLAGFNVYRFPAPTPATTPPTQPSFVYNGETYYLITAAPFYDPTGETSEFPDNTDDNQNTCVSFGADGASDTTVGGDDLTDQDGINGGPNGICESTANNNAVAPADDIQIAAPGTPQDPSRTLKLLPGVTYKYIVRVTDCGGRESTVNQSLTFKPGKIDRDTNVKATTSGTKARQHNIVNFKVKNTSESDLTVRNAASGLADTATLTWTNSAARLTKIELDGTTLWEDASASPTTTSPATVTFTGAKTLSGEATGKTMKLTFKKSDGTTNMDMRGNTITVTLSFRNESVYTSSVDNSTATCSVPFTMTVAPGAALSNTTQNPPTEGSPPLAVTPKKSDEAGVPPGWLVDPSSNVVIQTKATPELGTTVKTCPPETLPNCITVYYYADSDFVSAAPDPSVTSYTSLAMGCLLDTETPPNCSGNQWKKTITAQPGNRVWFFIEAIDSKGQFSADPAQTAASFIAFTYDQQATITVSFTASFVDPAAGDKRVTVQGTALDQGGSPVQGAGVIFTIGTESLTGTTDISGAFTTTSTTNFSSGDVTITVEVTKLPGYLPGTCSKTLPESSLGVICP